MHLVHFTLLSVVLVLLELFQGAYPRLSEWSSLPVCFYRCAYTAYPLHHGDCQQIDERMHAKILEATKRREQLWFGPSKAESGQANEAKSTDSDAGANRTSINALFSQIAAEVGQIPSELMSQEGADDLNGGDNVGRAGAASEDVSKQSLDIVSDPMTGLPVEPPPFAQVLHCDAISIVLKLLYNLCYFSLVGNPRVESYAEEWRSGSAGPCE